MARARRVVSSKSEARSVDFTRRAPMFSGTFYPSDPDELRALVRSLLIAARTRARQSGEDGEQSADPRGAASKSGTTHALIVPHAGYQYSGPVAASAFATLDAEETPLAVVVGPSHHIGFKGVAVPSVRWFGTPIGDLPVHRRTVERLCTFDDVIVSDAAHELEHSVEVQLPFLQTIYGTPSIVPLCSGAIDAVHLADILEAAVDAAISDCGSSVVIVSSDFSHYLPSSRARKLDARTIDQITSFDAQALTSTSLCGHIAVRGLLEFARRRGLRPDVLDARNSGDIAGDPNRVVGYAAISFS